MTASGRISDSHARPCRPLAVDEDAVARALEVDAEQLLRGRVVLDHEHASACPSSDGRRRLGVGLARRGSAAAGR